MAQECCRCTQRFDDAEMVKFDGTWVCAGCKPAYVQLLREGASTEDLLVARHKKLVVMGRNAQLPERCVKCNAPAEGDALKRDLSWHPPWVYVFLLVSILVYVVAAVITRKKATVHVPLCAEHRAKRRNGMAVAWVAFLLSIGAFVGGAFLSNVVLAIVGGVLILLAMIYGAVKSATVSPTRIDKEHVRLRGFCLPYLETLPDWSAT